MSLTIDQCAERLISIVAVLMSGAPAREMEAALDAIDLMYGTTRVPLEIEWPDELPPELPEETMPKPKFCRKELHSMDDPENLRFKANGSAQCKACHRDGQAARDARYRAKRRAARLELVAS